MPNFGQYGYVEPENGFNWKTLLIALGILFVGAAWYCFGLKKEEAKKKDDALPKLT